MRTNNSIMVILLFAARILIPIVITFVIAYLYDRVEGHLQERMATPNDSHFRNPPSESQLKACPIPVRAEAACSRWPNLPCWLALQLTEGRVPKDCLACAQFEESDLSHQFLD